MEGPPSTADAHTYSAPLWKIQKIIAETPHFPGLLKHPKARSSKAGESPPTAEQVDRTSRQVELLLACVNQLMTMATPEIAFLMLIAEVADGTMALITRTICSLALDQSETGVEARVMTLVERHTMPIHHKLEQKTRDSLCADVDREWRGCVYRSTHTCFISTVVACLCFN